MVSSSSRIHLKVQGAIGKDALPAFIALDDLFYYSKPCEEVSTSAVGSLRVSLELLAIPFYLGLRVKRNKSQYTDD